MRKLRLCALELGKQSFAQELWDDQSRQNAHEQQAGMQDGGHHWHSRRGNVMAKLAGLKPGAKNTLKDRGAARRRGAKPPLGRSSPPPAPRRRQDQNVSNVFTRMLVPIGALQTPGGELENLTWRRRSRWQGTRPRAPTASPTRPEMVWATPAWKSSGRHLKSCSKSRQRST